MDSLLSAAANPYSEVMGNDIFDTVTSLIYKNVIPNFSHETDYILFYESRA